MTEEKKKCAITRFFSRIVEKLDKKMEEKAKSSCGCCGPKSRDDSGGCCGR